MGNARCFIIFGFTKLFVLCNCISNTSEEMFAFNNFPSPSDWPNWMHHSLACKYLKLYAERFSLKPFIQLHARIKK